MADMTRLGPRFDAILPTTMTAAAPPVLNTAYKSVHFLLLLDAPSRPLRM